MATMSILFIFAPNISVSLSLRIIVVTFFPVSWSVFVEPWTTCTCQRTWLVWVGLSPKLWTLWTMTKKMLLVKRVFVYFFSILVFVNHVKKWNLIQLHVHSFQVCLSQFWITMTPLCYVPTWSECSLFSAICMRTGEIFYFFLKQCFCSLHFN